MVQRAGRGLEPAGRALEPAGWALVPTERASEPAGRALEPVGRALEPAVGAVEPAGRALEPAGRPRASWEGWLRGPGGRKKSVSGMKGEQHHYPITKTVAKALHGQRFPMPPH